MAPLVNSWRTNFLVELYKYLVNNCIECCIICVRILNQSFLFMKTTKFINKIIAILVTFFMKF